jgi:hypothetical protein
MKKNISTFFLTILANVVLFFILSSMFKGEGDPTEDAVYTFGTIIVILLSLIVSQLYLLIKKK